MDIAVTAGYERRIAIATKRQQNGAEGLPDQGASRRAAMQLTEAPGTTSHSPVRKPEGIFEGLQFWQPIFSPKIVDPDA
eukprot:3607293-Pyramimonas_sp.AAC.1